jgi:hypothetical protein
VNFLSNQGIFCLKTSKHNLAIHQNQNENKKREIHQRWKMFANLASLNTNWGHKLEKEIWNEMRSFFFGW